MNLSDFEFIPTEKQIQESNIFQFMQKHNISSLEELSQKAKDNSSSEDMLCFCKK